MENRWVPLDHETVLLPGDHLSRFLRCKAYLKRLKEDNLLIYYRMEAGLFNAMRRMDGIHGGWDSPTSFAKGMFTGHWLSAASMAYAADRDTELKIRVDRAIEALRKCQIENGNGWAFAVPEKHLSWLKRGKYAYNPFYSIHKSLMGYMDAWRYAGNSTALEILRGCADYFADWCRDVPRELMDRIMDGNETGGILEVWAELYGETGEQKHQELMRRFERPALYEALAEGTDFLTNMHANTTIPEIVGAARCHDVTGEPRYRDAVEEYWRQAVEQRGMFATGGQTSGEVWTPPGRLESRLGELTQEHCTVYNMMKLAEALLRWTGEAKYADYIERNVHNGVLAQTFLTGRSLDICKDAFPPAEYLVSYFLPLGFGVTKKWGTETDDFWCCHGTTVQANAALSHGVFYRAPGGLAVCQYIPARLGFGGGSVTLKRDDGEGEHIRLNGARAAKRPARPDTLGYVITFELPEPQETDLLLRMPWWLAGPARVSVDGTPVSFAVSGGFLRLRAAWQNQRIHVEFPKKLEAVPLPGEPNTVAFMDGPTVLAGLTDGQYELRGDVKHPETILKPHDERGWNAWNRGWRTVNQPKNILFVPLNAVTQEQYNVYFPVR